MNRRQPWWPLLILYTASLWAATLGAAMLMASFPDNWSFAGDTWPPLMILQSALYTLGPSLATAAFALLATTVAIGFLRTSRIQAALTDDPGGWPADDIRIEMAMDKRVRREAG